MKPGSTVRTWTRTSARERSPLVLGLVTLLVLTTPLASVAAGATDGASGSSTGPYVAPTNMNRVVGDPWLGGAWIGTQDVGVLFKPLPTGEGGSPFEHFGPRDGLPSALVHDVVATPERVFVGTGAGLAVIDKSTNEIQVVRHDDGTPIRANAFSVHTEGGRVWMGTASKGMFRVDPSTLEAEEVENPHNGSDFEDPVMGFASDGPELFISVTQYGLVRWNRDTGETQKYNFTARLDTPLYRRVDLTDENVWVGTSGDGAISYDRESGEGTEYSGGHTLKSKDAWDVHVSGDRVWFSTGTGTAWYDESDEEWRNYQMHSGWDWGRRSYGISTINGTVYATTLRGFVAEYDRANDTWVKSDWWSDEDILFWNTVTGCTEFQDRLVFTTGGRKSHYVDPETGRWSKVGAEPGATGPEVPSTLHWDADADEETLWIGAPDGLARYHAPSNEWTRHRGDGADWSDTTNEYEIVDVELGPDAAWLAVKTERTSTVNPDWNLGHVARYDRSTGEWTKWGPDEGLAGANVTSVFVQGDRVWTGLERSGLDAVNVTSDEVTHVYPSENRNVKVWDVASGGGHVWAASSEGLLRVNSSTLEVSRPEPLRDVPLGQLHWSNGTLWAGGSMNGLHKYDPDTNTVESFTIDQPVEDIHVYCMLERDGILYLGTQRGIDRLDLASETFIPKDSIVPDVGSEEETPEPSVSIREPTNNATVTLGETFNVSGTARGPDGASVLVRAPGSAWTRAPISSENWTVQLSIEDTATGQGTITARLVADGQTLAQAARPVTIASDGDESEAPRLEHSPVFHVTRGEPKNVHVTADPVPANLTGTLAVEAPGGGSSTHQLSQVEPGLLRGEIPAFDGEGEGSYRIRLTWDGGSARLPGPESAYGESYPFAIRDPPGSASAQLVVPGPIEVEPGAERTVRLTVQNTGNEPGTYTVVLDGDAAGWISQAPEELSIEPASSHTLRLRLTAPADQVGGNFPLEVRLEPTDPVRQEGTVATLEIQVQAQDTGAASADANATPSDDSRGTPLASAAAVLVTLVSTAAISARLRGET